MGGEQIGPTDVQRAKTPLCCVYVLLFPPTLPARCIIIILVYFFPKKVRRSELPSPNSLSHRPGAEQRGGGGFFRVAKHWDGAKHQMMDRGETWTLG